MLGLQFNTDIIGPATVNGIASAALYGVVAVALVLAYRVSRTVAFVQGGICLSCAYLFWLFTDRSPYLNSPSGQVCTPDHCAALDWPYYPSMVLVVAIGALAGGIYGALTMGPRMGNWSRITLTTFSLGIMLVLAGIFSSIWLGVSDFPVSPWGRHTKKMFGQFVSHHQMATLSILIGVVILLTYLLLRTRAGLYVRAIADDVEAAEIVGIPRARVGIGAYAVSGGVAALAGILLPASFGLSTPQILFIILRALLVAVVGGFASIPFALGGSMVLGLVENWVGGGVFGSVHSGTREVVLMLVVFGLILGINRFGRRSRHIKLEAQTL